MSTPPKLSDPSGTPRFAPRGEVKREKPIWTREQFGPWCCDVKVTPITGMRRGYPVFEVLARWERGPALTGRTPAGGMTAVDLYLIDRESPDLQLTGQQAQELAIELANVAADLLQKAIKPDLALLVRAIRA